MKENKQYKLKRWYPSLKKTVEVGCIITKIYTCGGYHYRGSDNEGVIFYVSGSQCENNPDFWELIEEEKPKPIWSDYYLKKYRWYRKCRKQTWYKHQFTNDALELSITFTGTWWALYGKINRYSDVVDTEVW